MMRVDELNLLADAVRADAGLLRIEADPFLRLLVGADPNIPDGAPESSRGRAVGGAYAW